MSPIAFPCPGKCFPTVRILLSKCAFMNSFECAITFFGSFEKQRSFCAIKLLGLFDRSNTGAKLTLIPFFLSVLAVSCACSLAVSYTHLRAHET